MFDQIFRNMSPVVKNLLIINVIVFLAVHLLAYKNIDLVNLLSLHHYASDGFMPYQYVTSMFLHEGMFHLFANMLGLVSFGANLERLLGAKRFLILYMVAGLAGNLFYHGFHMGELIVMGESAFLGASNVSLSNGFYSFVYSPELIDAANEVKANGIIFSRALGASGAVFGVFAAVFKYFPNTEVMLLFPPIPLKIKVLFAILMGGSLVLSIFPFAMQGVAHMAHFGGGVAGLVLVYFWQKNSNTFY